MIIAGYLTTPHHCVLRPPEAFARASWHLHGCEQHLLVHRAGSAIIDLGGGHLEDAALTATLLRPVRRASIGSAMGYCVSGPGQYAH